MEPIPCKDCILMAICNSKMHNSKTGFLSSAYTLQKECDILKKYIDDHHSKILDSTTVEVLLSPIHEFFMKRHEKMFYLKENIRVDDAKPISYTELSIEIGDI